MTSVLHLTLFKTLCGLLVFRRILTDLYKIHFGAAWILDVSDSLQLRLCVIAYTGPRAHRAATATEYVMCQHYFWSTMSADVKTIVRSCVHCLSTVREEKVLRPFDPTVHGTATNILLLLDYL